MSAADPADGLADRLGELRERAAGAARRAGRDPAQVRLLAVSKTFPAERVCAALALGLREFGESRVQEAQAKLPAVAELAPGAGARWHLIGALQSNKLRRAAQLFDVVQSLDRAELAHGLERACAQSGRRLDVFVQVNIDCEPQKAGAAPEGAAELARLVAAHCPHLRLAGLMAIPRAGPDAQSARPAFARLRALRDELEKQVAGSRLELSMGMSGDFEVAIEEGADWIRVGSALFGARELA